jgi:hypothetical protein
MMITVFLKSTVRPLGIGQPAVIEHRARTQRPLPMPLRPQMETLPRQRGTLLMRSDVLSAVARVRQRLSESL